MTLEELRAMLRERDVRLDLGEVLSVSRNAYLPYAQVFTHGYTAGGREKWTRVPELVIAPESASTRAGLLRMLADLVEEDE